MTQFRVAVVQAGPVPFDPERSIEKACGLASEAAERGAKIVVFPEAFVSAYPKGQDFGARVGMRSPEGRTDFRRYWESAIAVPSPATDSLGTAARHNNIYMVIGVIERDGGTLYCTALFFAPDGTLLGKHRKLMPTAMERLIWGFGDGSTLPVFETPLGRIGSVICWENYMPMLRMAMYSKGIQLYCAPTVDDRDTWIPTMQHIALEGRCFVLASCQYIKRGDYPEDYEAIHDDTPDTVMIRGGSCIVSPLGRILAGPSYDGECILTADIDLGDIARGKYDFDVTGHYARPDVFRLYVNECATPAVVWKTAETVDPFVQEKETS
ncbi:MAG: carbon-nitrogen hydrolase family protein [Deltaproteobacteria bacterium]|nr:carbon-nitrogen hydrolase family protein [Deltaproteobacteria bacterium]MBW2071881.1 carbon-nitrogen hydrolase family protein [Deltaproteobacteria bacterium]